MNPEFKWRRWGTPDERMPYGQQWKDLLGGDPLASRIAACLINEGILTPEDAGMVHDYALMGLKGFGATCLERLRQHVPQSERINGKLCKLASECNCTDTTAPALPCEVVIDLVGSLAISGDGTQDNPYTFGYTGPQ